MQGYRGIVNKFENHSHSSRINFIYTQKEDVLFTRNRYNLDLQRERINLFTRKFRLQINKIIVFRN